MKIAHWVLPNTSGMYRLAESMARAEGLSGLDSYLCDFTKDGEIDEVHDADIHVCHTHIPDAVRLKGTKPLKTVWIAHGTPEYVFTSSVINGLHNGYGFSDPWQLAQYWMQQADALVTFWPRHQKIWQSLCDKRTKVQYFPMGIDKDFWKPVASQGKFLGAPSLFTGENCDYSKWPLDLFFAWPWVWEHLPTAHLHAVQLPTDQHRWWYSLLNRNGSGFKTISSNTIFAAESLRNAFVSNDYYIGLVRYGDANRMSLEANASGAKTISYAGNEYSDFWLQEGDQRGVAKSLLAILKGEVEPRKKTQVSPISEMVQNMKTVYESIL